MKGKWTEGLKKEEAGSLAVIGLTAVLLFGLSVMGSLRNGRLMAENQKAQAAEQMMNHQREAFQPSLSAEDEELLEELTGFMAGGNWEGAARMLRGYKVPSEEFPCLYSQGVLSPLESSGQGLIFTRPYTLFYGEFVDGKPQGEGTALQVLEFNEGTRYDYSYGTWEKGKMNGNGECGYNYYDGVSEGITKESVKKGLFEQDLMEGEISYTSVNQKEESTTWQFWVKAGRIVPDERWTKEEDSLGEIQYLILSPENPDHAYTVTESAMAEARWKNLISYE